MNSKKQKIVLAILTTVATVLSWLSGYFVMQIVYDSIIAAIVFGTIWAIIVFCETRFSYISLKIDGRIKITKEEVKSNTWHIIAALLVSLLVTIPLLLKVFAADIVTMNPSATHNLALQLNSLTHLFPTNWFCMLCIIVLVVFIFQLPIFLRMASEDN